MPTILAVNFGSSSLKTAMCFTPDAGLFMGSRSGDIDPGILLFLAGRDETATLTSP